MHNAILKQKFSIKPNWWLWLGISVPLCVYLWQMPQDRGGELVSDWSVMMDWLRHYQLDHEFWRDVVGGLLLSFGFSLSIGWFAQFFIRLAWQAFTRKRHDTPHAA
jgi:hypothetical protein